jgi:cytochrome bd-type quinol oxidase subunit 2
MLLNIAIMAPFLLFFGAAVLTLLAAVGLRWAPTKFGRIAVRVLAAIARSLSAIALLMTLAAVGLVLVLIWSDDEGFAVWEQLAFIVFFSIPAALSLAALLTSRAPAGRPGWVAWMSPVLIMMYGLIFIFSIGLLYLPAGLMLLVAAIAQLALSDFLRTEAQISPSG